MALELEPQASPSGIEASEQVGTSREAAGFGPTSGCAKCLVPMLDALGWRGDERALFEALPEDAATMDQVGFLNTMATLKFAGGSRPGRLSQLNASHLPCLFVPLTGEPIVVVARGGNECLAFDGDTGDYRKLALDRRRGSIIHFSPISAQQTSLLKRQLNWFRTLFGRFSSLAAQAIVVTLLLTLLSIATPGFVGQIYNAAATANARSTLLYLGLGMVLLMIADGGLRFLRSQIFLFLSARIGNVVGNEVLRRLLFLPLSYTETANLGAQISRVKDFENIREFFAGPSLVALLELPMVALLLLALWFVGGQLVLVPLLALVLFACVGMVAYPAMQHRSAEASRVGSAKQSFLVELLTELEALQLARATRAWQERYRVLSAETAIAGYSASQITAAVNAFSYVMVMGAGLLTMGWGITEVLNGRFQPGALVTTMMLVWRTLTPIGAGFGVLLQFTRIRKSIEQLDRLMNIVLEHRQETTLAIHRELKGRVHVSGATLRYVPEAPPALLGVSFALQPGQMLAIVGHDGAGKTSLLKLILGLYVPQAGQVLLDGMNVRQMEPNQVRHGIAYAPRASYLFSGTVRSNLLLSHPAATEADLRRAVEQVGVLEDILALPEGFDTRLDETRLTQLSTSFKKRVCLARALLRPSKLLLMDEPEADLMPDEAERFADRLFDMRGHTTILVATRLPELIQLADRLLVLENGRVQPLSSL